MKSGATECFEAVVDKVMAPVRAHQRCSARNCRRSLRPIARVRDAAVKISQNDCSRRAGGRQDRGCGDQR